MSKHYDDLSQLNELRQKGALTEEEYQTEKRKILDRGPRAGGEYWGMNETQYSMLMHLSQFAGFLLPFAGLVLPIVMWSLYKDRSPFIDANGRHITNWLISACIYGVVSFLLCFVLIGIPLLLALLVVNVVFVILGAVKANSGNAWRYP